MRSLLPALLAALALAACTIPFTPGDSQPGTYTPTAPVNAASAPGPSRY